MMDLVEFIRNIEENYDIMFVKVNGIPVWPILRIPYAFAYRRKLFNTTNDKAFTQSSQSSKEKIDIRCKVANKLKLLGADPQGTLMKSLKNYNYIAISSFSNKRNLHNRVCDIFVGDLIDILGSDEVMELDRLPPEKNSLLDDYIVSFEMFDMLVSILRRFYPIRKEQIMNYHLLDELNSRFDLTVPFVDITRNFWAYYKLFKKLFKFWKARFLFVVCYYCIPNNYIVYAARKAGLMVVEVQHGIINDQHPAYNIFVNLDKNFLPHYLLSFGEVYRQMITESFYAEAVNIVPVGHFYLEWIKNEYTPPSEVSVVFDEFRKKYKKLIAVTSQTVVSDFLIEFVNKVAASLPQHLFIFIPRNAREIEGVEFSSNIKVLNHLNCYEILKHVDFHLTVFSTCGIEALFLGIPTIFVNYKNLPRNYYGDYIPEKNGIVKYVNTEMEFIKTIKNWESLDVEREQVSSYVSNFFIKNRKVRLLKVISNLKIVNN